MVALDRLKASDPSIVRRTCSWSPELVKVCTRAKYAPSGEKARYESSSLGLMPLPGTAPSCATTRSPPPLSRWRLKPFASEAMYARKPRSGLHACRPSMNPPPGHVAAMVDVPLNRSSTASTLVPELPGLPWVAYHEIIVWVTSCGWKLPPLMPQMVFGAFALVTSARTRLGAP